MKAIRFLFGLSGRAATTWIAGAMLSASLCGQEPFVVSSGNDSILRYNGITGAFIDVFAFAGMNGPRQLRLGPNGDLFVANGFGNNITRYDGTTGAYLGEFVTAGQEHGLFQPAEAAGAENNENMRPTQP